MELKALEIWRNKNDCQLQCVCGDRWYPVTSAFQFIPSSFSTGSVKTSLALFPPRRFLLVNNSERENGSAEYNGKRSPRLYYFFPLPSLRALFSQACSQARLQEAHFKMADFCVFHYLEQPIMFWNSQSVKHLKLGTVLLFGFSSRSQFMFKRIFGWFLFENDQCSHIRKMSRYTR